jgi:hypothetical protein
MEKLMEEATPSPMAVANSHRSRNSREIGDGVASYKAPSQKRKLPSDVPRTFPLNAAIGLKQLD